MKCVRILFVCLTGFIVSSGFLTTSHVLSYQQTQSVSSGDAYAFKSTDGGISWSAILDFSTGISAHVAQVFVVDPSTSSTIYVGTNNGLLKTTDSGGSWSDITDGLSNRDIKAIAVDPQHTTVLYTIAYSHTNGSENIYKSTDAGKNWKQISLSSSVYSLLLDPHNPSVLYAGGSDPDGAGVYRTTDGGGSWSYVRIARLGLGATIDQLSLDPMATTNLYAANRGGRNRGGFSKSTDAGRSWRSTYLEELTIRTLQTVPYSSSMLYALTSEGLLNSTDGGENWTEKSRGLNISRLQCLAVQPTDPAILYLGTDDGLLKSTDGGDSWATTNLNRKIVSLVIDPTNPAVIYAGGVADPPRVISASVEGKRLIVEGEGFHDGAAIYVDSQRQKTANDAENPHTILIGKKAGKNLAHGQTVTLWVVDADGFGSGPITFMRPSN